MTTLRLKLTDVSEALMRLLWTSVADRDDCTCEMDGDVVVDPCPLCQACVVLGFGRYQGPDWLACQLMDASKTTAPPELLPQPAPANPPRGEPAWPIAFEIAKTAGASPELLELMYARDAQGRVKYGVPLCLDDGRDTSLDALQEAIDLVVYSVKAGQEADGRAQMESWQRIAGLATELADEILRLRDKTCGRE